MVIFGTIFGVGFLVLILNLIFGGDGDTDASFDADHDVGGAVHGPSIFSLKMVALLMVGFGAGGFGARATTDWSMFQSSMAGVVGAGIVGIMGYFILRLFYASQASSTIGDSDVIGATANIIDAINEGQNGQVSCVVRGRETTFLARTADGSTVPRGAQVRIVSRAGGVVTVKRIDQ